MNVRTCLALLLLSLPSALMALPQSGGSSPGITAPPKLLRLVHQSFQLGKAGARQKSEVAMSRACEPPGSSEFLDRS